MRPQLRAERFLQLSDYLRITPQVALSSPVGTDFFQTPTSGPDGLLLGEETGWPNIETRVGIGVGEKADGARFQPLEFGYSGAVSELRFFKSDLVNPAQRFTTLVWMYGADFRWQINPRWAVVAEGYYGNALGSYAAGNKQTFNRDMGEGILASGGFLELECQFNPQWIAHCGFMSTIRLTKMFLSMAALTNKTPTPILCMCAIATCRSVSRWRTWGRAFKGSIEPTIKRGCSKTK